MTITSGSELITGLSDLPLFIASLIMTAVSVRSRGSGRVKSAWTALSAVLSVTVFFGGMLHIVRLDEKYMRWLWPAVYTLMTLLAAMFWIQIIRIYRGEETARTEGRKILAAGAAVSMINGAVRFLYGTDMAPIFSAFALPAVVSCAFIIIKGTNERNRSISLTFGAVTAALLLAVLSDALITEPLTISGVECAGAVFSHLYIVAAMFLMFRVISASAEETDV